MSWQDYVDNQLMASQCVTKACIAGHDGNVWASSKGFEVSFRSISQLDHSFVIFKNPFKQKMAKALYILFHSFILMLSFMGVTIKKKKKLRNFVRERSNNKL